MEEKVRFNGRKIIMPWAGWENIQISPEGIHTHRGVFHPADIDKLLWMASFYQRGELTWREGHAATP